MPDPKLTPPSATVEPFDALGQPPVQSLPAKKRHSKAIIMFLLLLVLLGTAGYYAFQNGWLAQYGFGSNPATTQATPTSSPSGPLDSALEETDTALGEANASLNNAGTGLDDKQGDLGE
jgi:hypothetical protein